MKQGLRNCMAVTLCLVFSGLALPASAYVTKFVDSGQELGGSATSRGIDLGDLDGDGDIDAFVTTWTKAPYTASNTVWINNGQGSFESNGQTLPPAVGGHSVALGDLDDDGDLDAFVANSGNQPNTIWWNDGSGQFTDSGQRLGASDSFEVELGDFDSDGDLDAFVVNWNGRVNPGGQANTIWRNDGNGVFAQSVQGLPVDVSWYIAVQDIDGDNDLDVIVANDGANSVWKNDGTGMFSQAQSLGNNKESRGIALGDINGDGHPDLFITNYVQPDTVWLNDGSGSFFDSGQKLGNSKSRSVMLEDVDKDGDLDAFVVNDENQANILWLNTGSGHFVDSGQRPGTSDSRHFTMSDLDGDGDLDAYITNFGQPDQVWFNQGELILTMKADMSITAVENYLNAEGVGYVPLFDDTRGDLALKAMLGISRTYLLTPNSSTNLEALRITLSNRADVEDCIYNQYLYFDSLPNDDYYNPGLLNTQWNLDTIGLTDYWQNFELPPPADVALAILDSGIDGRHPDLADAEGHLLPGRNYSRFNDIGDDANEEDSDITDENGHGTHLAGIAGALTDNVEGIAGIAGNTNILPLKVGDNLATLAGVFKAIEYAVDSQRGVGAPANIPQYDAVVINASWSNSDLEFGEEAARHVAGLLRWVRYASLSNVPFVTSMGNMNNTEERYPAKFHDTIAVGATERDNSRWQGDIGGSNYCSSLDMWLDLAAPGGRIFSTVIQETGGLYPDYDRKDGTSMAAAHVTGALGLLLSRNPQLTAEALRSIVKETARKQGEFEYDKYQHGAGILNVAQALPRAESEQHLRLEPAIYDFGNVEIGQSRHTTIRIENPCNRSLEIFGASITQFQSGDDGVEIVSREDTEFRVLAPASCRDAASGQVCDVEIEFAPKDLGFAGSEGKKWAELDISSSFFTCAEPSSSDPAHVTIQLRGATEFLFPLTVSATGTGGGSITGDGIDCGTACWNSYPKGMTVLLQAQSGSSSVFAGWSDQECGVLTECAVTMDSAKTITAEFTIVHQDDDDDDDRDGNNDTIQGHIPEPGTVWLLGIGLLALFGFAGKKFRRR